MSVYVYISSPSSSSSSREGQLYVAFPWKDDNKNKKRPALLSLTLSLSTLTVTSSHTLHTRALVYKKRGQQATVRHPSPPLRGIFDSHPLSSNRLLAPRFISLSLSLPVIDPLAFDATVGTPHSRVALLCNRCAEKRHPPPPPPQNPHPQSLITSSKSLLPSRNPNQHQHRALKPHAQAAAHVYISCVSC